MRKRSILLCIGLLLSLAVWSAKKYKLVEIETNIGMLKVRLYTETPIHSENFLKLIGEHHYDSLLFHRVIKDFMIQGGASDSKGAEKGKMVGVVDPGYTLEAEIRPEYIHKKGALAAARQGDEVNPEKRSSGEQFYVVQGNKYTDEQLNDVEKRKLYMAKSKFAKKLFKPKEKEYRRYMASRDRIKADSLLRSVDTAVEAEFKDYKGHLISEEARAVYREIGGTPFLDGEYTVFGEVVEGLEIVDKIAAVKTDRNDRPEEDVIILSMRLTRK